MFRSFINNAGNCLTSRPHRYSPFTHIHYNAVNSIFIRIAGLRTPASDSGSGLRVLLTSLNHRSQLHNIIPSLLQHESTSQFTTESYNLVTDQKYIYSPAIHTTHRIDTKSYLSLQNLSLNSQTFPR